MVPVHAPLQYFGDAVHRQLNLDFLGHDTLLRLATALYRTAHAGRQRENRRGRPIHRPTGNCESVGGPCILAPLTPADACRCSPLAVVRDDAISACDRDGDGARSPPRSGPSGPAAVASGWPAPAGPRGRARGVRAAGLLPPARPALFVRQL